MTAWLHVSLVFLLLQIRQTATFQRNQFAPTKVATDDSVASVWKPTSSVPSVDARSQLSDREVAWRGGDENLPRDTVVGPTFTTYDTWFPHQEWMMLPGVRQLCRNEYLQRQSPERNADLLKQINWKLSTTSCLPFLILVKTSENSFRLKDVETFGQNLQTLPYFHSRSKLFNSAESGETTPPSTVKTTNNNHHFSRPVQYVKGKIMRHSEDLRPRPLSTFNDISKLSFLIYGLNVENKLFKNPITPPNDLFRTTLFKKMTKNVESFSPEIDTGLNPPTILKHEPSWKSDQSIASGLKSRSVSVDIDNTVFPLVPTKSGLRARKSSTNNGMRPIQRTVYFANLENTNILPQSVGKTRLKSDLKVARTVSSSKTVRNKKGSNTKHVTDNDAGLPALKISQMNREENNYDENQKSRVRRSIRAHKTGGNPRVRGHVPALRHFPVPIVLQEDTDQTVNRKEQVDNKTTKIESRRIRKKKKRIYGRFLNYVLQSRVAPPSGGPRGTPKERRVLVPYTGVHMNGITIKTIEPIGQGSGVKVNFGNGKRKRKVRGHHDRKMKKEHENDEKHEAEESSENKVDDEY